jgi:secreted trypsin-like serine protease
VLTAAHCLDAGTQRVAAVLHDASGNGRAVNAVSWVNHPGYEETRATIINDAAVVNLGEAMPNPTMPLLVSSGSRKGDPVYMAGWGLPGNELAVGFGQLSGAYEDHLRISFNGSLSNTCPGDSGGPLYREVGGRQGVVGLTSTGTTRECGAGDQSLFTNTQSSSVLGFIRGHVPGVGEI